MLTPVQQVILHCLFIAPEDPRGFEKLCARERTQKHRINNRDKIRARKKELWMQNHDKNIEYKREWQAKNRVILREQARELYYKNVENSRRQNAARKKRQWPYIKPRVAAYLRKRYSENSQFRLAQLLRTRIRRALVKQNATKRNSTTCLVGVSFQELRAHLEKQFRPGMTWENHGTIWEIDHIRPCASFDLSDFEQQKICFHYSNLQPLFSEENRKKGDAV